MGRQGCGCTPEARLKRQGKREIAAITSLRWLDPPEGTCWQCARAWYWESAQLAAQTVVQIDWARARRFIGKLRRRRALVWRFWWPRLAARWSAFAAEVATLWTIFWRFGPPITPRTPDEARRLLAFYAERAARKRSAEAGRPDAQGDVAAG